MPSANRTASVLLVEDDPDYRRLLHEAFEEAGFRTFTAANGESALAILRTEPVDLVVSDFIMPELNGLELCRLLADDVRLSKLKVILYSCNTDGVFRRRAREFGAVDYLPKSDDPERFVQQIRQLAGLAGEAAAPGADARPPDRLETLARSAKQLRVLLDSLLDFTRILASSENTSPALKVAQEAVERTAADIRRVLGEIEAACEAAPAQRTVSDSASRVA